MIYESKSLQVIAMRSNQPTSNNSTYVKIFDVKMKIKCWYI